MLMTELKELIYYEYWKKESFSCHSRNTVCIDIHPIVSFKCKDWSNDYGKGEGEDRWLWRRDKQRELFAMHDYFCIR